ncbi:uncharacterized protein LOC128199701 isoform X2 [Bicyclus anynana]|nr:uncharacterized protein LOC128199701 isoform X2 [Bicyclus anynana]
MESKQQAHGDHFEGKEATPQEKRSAENRDERAQSSSGVVSSTQEDLVPIGIISKRSSIEGSQEVEPAEDESSKRKKKKDNEDKELMGKPAPVARSSTGRNKLPYRR